MATTALALDGRRAATCASSSIRFLICRGRPSARICRCFSRTEPKSDSFCILGGPKRSHQIRRYAKPGHGLTERLDRVRFAAETQSFGRQSTHSQDGRSAADVSESVGQASEALQPTPTSSRQHVRECARPQECVVAMGQTAAAVCGQTLFVVSIEWLRILKSSTDDHQPEPSFWPRFAAPANHFHGEL